MKQHLLVYIFTLFIGNSFCQVLNYINDVKMADVLTNSHQYSGFGKQASISGNYAIVGASNFLYGSFYTLEKDSTGMWIRTQEFSPNINVAQTSAFGRSVDISGDFFIVGNEYDKTDVDGLNTINNAGAAFIYKRDTNGVWSLAQKITASNREWSDYFGRKVSISGDFAFVSAPYDDDDETEQNEINSTGAVYVFKKDQNGYWSQIQKIIEFDRVLNDQFGDHSIDSYNDLLIIGNNKNSLDENGSNSIANSGAAYIYQYDSLANKFLLQQKIVKPNRLQAGNGQLFGLDVTINDHLLAVIEVDTVYVFKNNNDIWEVQSTINPFEHVAINNTFTGTRPCISLSNNLLAIGIPWVNNGEGQVIIYEKSDSTTWNYRQTLVYSEQGEEIIESGISLDFSENQLIVGDSRTILNPSNGPNTCQVGAVRLFEQCNNQSAIYPFSCNSYNSPSGLYEWTESGTYYDTVTNVNGCDSIICIHLTIQSLISSVAQIDDFTFQAVTPGASYQWLDCTNNFLLLEGETNQTLTATTNGSFAVELTQNGCVDTSECVSVTTISLTDSHFNGLTIAPNPTENAVTINFGELIDAVFISIFDASGRIIFEQKFNSISECSLLTNEAPGIYTISLLSDSKSEVVKAVKQ